MNKDKQKSEIYYSIEEFESNFLPLYFQKKREEEIIDPKVFGVNIASRVLKKLKIQVHTS